jgi:hypothetical protein
VPAVSDPDATRSFVLDALEDCMNKFPKVNGHSFVGVAPKPISPEKPAPRRSLLRRLLGAIVTAILSLGSSIFPREDENLKWK